MVFTTAISNFWGIPGLIGMIYVKKDYYNAFLSYFTILTSFMYHLLDAIQIESFLFDEGHWHRLDNIGAITSFISLVVYLMDNPNPAMDEKLNFLGLFLTLIL